MNQETTTNKLNNTKVNNIKVNNVKGNDIKPNNTKVNNKTSATTPVQTGYSGKNIAGMALLAVVLIIVLGSSYWLYNYYSKKSFITVVDVDAMTDVKIASSSFNIASNLVPNSTYSNEYTISMWINIIDYNYKYGKEKVILRRGEKGSGNPEILLAPKTNDLIVRIKLQTPTATNVSSGSSSDTFIDIPILPTLNLDSYEETESEGKLIYDEAQSNTSVKETFNITSYPAPVNFESNSSNNNESLNIKSDLGENKVNYPTIKYISNHNNNFDEQYFSMISGNDVDSTKSISSNDMNNYTRGGNHSTNESFDDVSDIKKIMGDLFNDIFDIMSALVSPTPAENEQYVIQSSVYSMIIEYLNQINKIVKAGTSNFDTITGNFKTTMNKVSTNPKFSNYIDKLVTDITSLVKYNKITYDYTSLTTDVNESPLIKSYNLTLINENIFNPTNPLIDNLIILLQQLLVVALQGTINENIPKDARIVVPITTAPNCVNIENDPTVGICSIKMIPLQKWVNVIVSVYNQVVDIYVDGLLTSSCVLKKFPAISTSDISLTPDGGFSGYISRVKFLNSAMTVQKAKDIYNDGPIYSPSLYSLIPNWVYWTLLVIIILSIGYSYYV
jgi:hypothetical protein